MNSNIFNALGLGKIDPAIIFFILLIIIIVLLILTIVQMVKISNLKKKYDSFLLGKDGKSLEKHFTSVFADIDLLKTANKKNSDNIKVIKKNLLKTYQKMGLVRYDAFREMGGQLSFSLALLDDEDNGFLINSVHSSEGCYTYAKEIVEGQSLIDLGEEEQEALEKAMRG